MKKNNLLLILVLSILAFLSRLIWHVPNFSPLSSVLIFSAFLAKDKKTALLPLLALLASDLIIGFYHWAVMLAVYLATALNIFIGYSLKKNHSSINTLSAAIFSGVSFFFITNLAVWAASDWYTKDANGLLLCFTLAVPFFKSTLASNILYSLLLFGSHAFAQEKNPQKKTIVN